MGSSAFKVLVDPKLTPNGQVIIYAALSGNNGGVWRSQNTGQTWQLMRGGQATDIAMNFSSGTGAPGGNLQIIYSAFHGGQVPQPQPGRSNLMAGGMATESGEHAHPAEHHPNTQPNPNGAQGRIGWSRRS